MVYVGSASRTSEVTPLLGDDAPTRRWRATFEGDAPDALLELLAADDRFAPAASVTGVGSVVEDLGVGRASVFADYRGHFVTGAGDFSVSAGAGVEHGPPI